VPSLLPDTTWNRYSSSSFCCCCSERFSCGCAANLTFSGPLKGVRDISIPDVAYCPSPNCTIVDLPATVRLAQRKT